MRFDAMYFSETKAVFLAKRPMYFFKVFFIGFLSKLRLNLSIQYHYPKVNYKDVLDRLSQEVGVDLLCCMLTEIVGGKVKVYAHTNNHRISKETINRINNYDGKTLLSDEMLKRDYSKIEEGKFSTYFTAPNEEKAPIIADEKAWLINGEGFDITKAHYFIFPINQKLLFLFAKNEKEAQRIKQYEKNIDQLLTEEML